MTEVCVRGQATSLMIKVTLEDQTVEGTIFAIDPVTHSLLISKFSFLTHQNNDITNLSIFHYNYNK